MYLALAKLDATNVYFLLNQETIVDLTLKVQPKVLFLSIEPPAQFASVKPWSVTPSTYIYNNP